MGPKTVFQNFSNRLPKCGTTALRNHHQNTLKCRFTTISVLR